MSLPLYKKVRSREQLPIKLIHFPRATRECRLEERPMILCGWNSNLHDCNRKNLPHVVWIDFHKEAALTAVDIDP